MTKEAGNTMLYGGRIGLGEYLVINDENYRWELSNAIVYSLYKRGEPIKLSELIYHPELFSASPLLKDVNVFFENANENSGRVENLERIFSSKNLSDTTVYLTLNFSHYESTRTEFRTIESSEPDLAKESILLHELQHILQAIHNRPSGTTVLAGRIEANATLAALKNKAVLGILTTDEEFYYKYYSYIDSRNELESLFYYSDDGEMEARRAVRHWLNFKGIEYLDPLQEYFGYYEFKNGGMITRKSDNGGYQYFGDDMQRAKKADLLTLPENVLGTNCGNCQYQSNHFCLHKEIRLPVTPRMCCALWNNSGATRSWVETNNTTIHDISRKSEVGNGAAIHKASSYLSASQGTSKKSRGSNKFKDEKEEKLVEGLKLQIMALQNKAFKSFANSPQQNKIKAQIDKLYNKLHAINGKFGAGAIIIYENKPEILRGNVGMLGDGGEIILNNFKQQAIDDEIMQSQFGTQALL